MNLIGYSDYIDPPDPPDLPTHGPCDHCGEWHDNGDLTKVKRCGETKWLCDDCLEGESDGNENS